MSKVLYILVGFVLGVVLVVLANQANAEEPLWTSCRVTNTGQMAITLPPEMEGDDEQIKLAVAQCRENLKSAKVINDLTGNILPPANE